MKISTSDIPAIIGQYVDSEVAPIASGMQKFGAYSLVFVIQNKIKDIIDQYGPTMKMIGIMDDEQMLDMDAAREMASFAMQKAHKVNVLGFIMDKHDIDSLYTISQRYGR